mgnify:FL=1
MNCLLGISISPLFQTNDRFFHSYVEEMVKLSTVIMQKVKSSNHSTKKD